MITVDSSVRLIPIEKTDIFNKQLPTVNTNILPNDITSTYSTTSDLTIYVCISVSGVLSITRTVSGVTVTEKLNSGNALVASAAYIFTVSIKPGDSINVQYSVTSGIIYTLRIDETSGG